MAGASGRGDDARSTRSGLSTSGTRMTSPDSRRIVPSAPPICRRLRLARALPRNRHGPAATEGGAPSPEGLRATSRVADTAVITVNDEIASILVRRYKPRRIEVVHNCPERWSPPAARPDLIREAAGIPDGAPIVLYHGGLTAGRGIDMLVDSMLVNGLEDVHLVLMGYGDLHDQFEGVAREERWNGRIHVIDPVPPSALLSWVASADVGAMPNPGATRNDTSRPRTSSSSVSRPACRWSPATSPPCGGSSSTTLKAHSAPCAIRDTRSRSRRRSVRSCA